jgi:hypothetical protein
LQGDAYHHRGTEQKDFHDLVTGDESWFMLEYEHEAKWAVSREKLHQE